MARAIHQLIAQPQIPDVAGDRLRALATTEGIKDRREGRSQASERLAQLDQGRIDTMKQRSFEQAVQMRAGGADDATVLGYLNEVGTELGLPQADPSVIARIDAIAQSMQKPDEGFTLSPGQSRFDASGNPVASITEPDKQPDLKEVFDPETETMRFVPKDQAAGMASKAPSAKSDADARKAEAQATKAELDLLAAQRTEEGKADTANQIQALAQSLLKEEDGEIVLADGVSRVFGAIDRFLPSVGQAATAEAKINQLVSMLTLENTDKMTGVLSESDIKILRDAGTLLGSKGVPEPAALAELKKVAGVIERNPEIVGGEHPEGTIIRNKAGEQMIRKNGEWVDYAGS